MVAALNQFIGHDSLFTAQPSLEIVDPGFGLHVTSGSQALLLIA